MRTPLLSLEAALDVVLKHGFLIRLTVLLLRDDESQSFSVFLSCNSTVSDVKRLTREHLDTPEREQRLYSLGSDGDQKPLFYGQLQAETTGQVGGGDILVIVKLRNVDPLTDSLYGLVGLQNWKERDEVMAKLQCTPRQGYKGHDLVIKVPLVEEKGKKQKPCARCGTGAYGEMFIPRSGSQGGTTCTISGSSVLFKELRPMTCVKRSCSFCICTRCFERVSSIWTAPKDPESALTDLALRLGRKLADLACTQSGNMEGLPLSAAVRSIHSNLMPPLFSPNHGHRIQSDTKVLHNGVRLRIQFNAEAHTFLKEAARVPERIIQQAEMDEICVNGMTLQEIGAIREHNLMWPILHHCIQSSGWLQDTSCVSLSFQLASFGLKEVVYHIDFDLSGGGVFASSV